MVSRRRVWWRGLMLSMWSFSIAHAQAQEVPAIPDPHTSQVGIVAKPTHKADQVLTSDPIALLAVRHAPVSGTDLLPGNTGHVNPLIADETARKAAELASLEQQIGDNQKRIVLLLRLFVDDERAFLNDPANTNVNPAVAERRRYEQDELRWETAELARLKAKLRLLTGSH